MRNSNSNDLSNIAVSSLENLSRIAELPRHLISDGYDEALSIIEEIARDKGLEYVCHSFPTGYDCGTWIIPEKWILKRALLKDKHDKIILDSDKDPLCCISYSLPFKGKVSRDELISHLHTSAHCPEAMPFVFKYYNRDWGLCSQEEIKNSLNDDFYYVSIDSEFLTGELKVGEIIVKGKFEESFILASHLCHPFQVNDGPIGIFPTVEILSKMSEKGTHYTFRQLIVPENIGSAAWLSKNKKLIPKLKGGLFIEMIGTDLGLRLHHSFDRNTIVDKLTVDIMNKLSQDFIEDDFVYANDERQFNGPGVKIPMLGFNRSYMSRKQKYLAAFDYYHSSFDNFDNINRKNYSDSIDILESIISAYDCFLIKPVPNFIGEPFLSRYDLHIDSFEGIDNLKKANEIMDVLFKTGDNLTIFEISQCLQFPLHKTKDILDMFEEKKLIHYYPF